MYPFVYRYVLEFPFWQRAGLRNAPQLLWPEDAALLIRSRRSSPDSDWAQEYMWSEEYSHYLIRGYWAPAGSSFPPKKKCFGVFSFFEWPT